MNSICRRLFRRMVRWSWREAVVPAYHPMVFDGAAARIVHLPRIGVREGFQLIWTGYESGGDTKKAVHH